MLLRALLVVAVVLAGGAVGGGVLYGGEGSAGGLEGRVARVVDGDTVGLDLGGGRRETVRYIGVDTPETHHPTKGVQCYGPAASAFNERLVGGERVRLELDAEQRDRYGRLLAYVVRERDGLLINAELARAGYARTLTIAPNDSRAGEFARLVARARQEGRGLWGAC